MDPTRDPDRLLTVAELARRLSLGDATVRKLARAGQLPALQVGGQLRFRWADVVEALRLAPTQKAVPA